MQPTLGIDLGTTNCAVARAEEAGVEVLGIPQLVNPGEVRAESLLPSCLYLPRPNEFAPGALALPWDENPPYVTGELAKKRGPENPARFVHSAKSWLAVAADMPHLSAVEASRAYLAHLRAATPDFDTHNVLLTVPASFDAAARNLTLEAAQQAGYPTPVLLEEPQAAFYAWLERHPDWRERIHPGALILVIDIGGGTTDFTLIRVTDDAGELALERIAVGEHILLGGDNMDLALARAVEADMPKIDPAQLHALWQRCRVAKEKLLAPGATQAEEPVTILGRGTGLIGGTLKAALRRTTLEQVLLDGFFPLAAAADVPPPPPPPPPPPGGRRPQPPAAPPPCGRSASPTPPTPPSPAISPPSSAASSPPTSCSMAVSSTPRCSANACSPSSTPGSPHPSKSSAVKTSCTPSPAARPTTVSPVRAAACASAAACPARITSASNPPCPLSPASRRP
jgi:hypothetical protein